MKIVWNGMDLVILVIGAIGLLSYAQRLKNGGRKGMSELIDRQALLNEYDKAHVGPPGKARKLIKDAPTVPSSTWHRTEDPPKENGRYFVSLEGVATTDEYKNGVWLYASMFNQRITHWMPLPEPPKEEN